ncbi:MAG: hypothetical protein DHS20C18_53770 [Saprospiraceae bacterium]|nr:MAG: hypothetical protein DHS20C18_53770 [Saprospiraceae bacterium]
MPKLANIKKIAQLTGHNAAIFALSASAQPTHFLSAAGDGWVVEWDLQQPETGRLLAKVETQIFSVLYLPAMGQVVVGNMNGGVHWVDLKQPDRTLNVLHHQKGVYGIERVGEWVFTLGGEGRLSRWSIAERRSVESFQLSNRSLRAIAHSPERQELAVGASDHNIYVLDANTLELKHVIERAHDNSVFALHYHPDGDLLYSGGRDAHLKVWDAHLNFANVSSQPAHLYTINDIAFHPNGQLLATASRDRTIKIWDAATFQLLKVLDTIRDGGHINSVNRLFWSNYDNCLISASDDRSIILWGVS